MHGAACVNREFISTPPIEIINVLRLRKVRDSWSIPSTPILVSAHPCPVTMKFARTGPKLGSDIEQCNSKLTLPIPRTNEHVRDDLGSHPPPVAALACSFAFGYLRGRSVTRAQPSPTRRIGWPGKTASGEGAAERGGRRENTARGPRFYERWEATSPRDGGGGGGRREGRRAPAYIFGSSLVTPCLVPWQYMRSLCMDRGLVTPRTAPRGRKGACE